MKTFVRWYLIRGKEGTLWKKLVVIIWQKGVRTEHIFFLKEMVIGVKELAKLIAELP